MKWPKTKQTANAGVIFLQSVVNDHGSIFHPVHQENDVGIDGFIELVDVGEASGQLVAVQVKSGDSYRSSDDSGFRIPVDEAHLRYWSDHIVPVIIVAYSPSKKIGAWVSVRDFIEHWEYQEKGNISAVDIRDHDGFTSEALGKKIAGLAHIRSDERILLKCADKCLSSDPQERRDGFNVLRAHPDSRRLKITTYFARKFILDTNEETAKDALYALGYGVGRFRWSWNPNNKEEAEVINFSGDLCSSLSKDEIRRLIELCDGSPFNGPYSLCERCFDVICHSFDTAVLVLEEIVFDVTQPMDRRANALFMLNYGNFEDLLGASDEIMKNEMLREIMVWIFGSEEAVWKEKNDLGPRLIP